MKETPGTVSVIDAETIARRLIENVADLVKFEPGVYIETNVTRIGLNGFNIRGIGGNRVMTQVDGVETSEQFDFGPFNVHQFALDLDTLKTAEIVRSAGSSLYGSDALGGVVSFFTKDPADYLPAQPVFHLGAKTLFDGRGARHQRQRRRSPAAGRARRRRCSSATATATSRGNKGSVQTENADADRAQSSGSPGRPGARQAGGIARRRQHAARRRSRSPTTTSRRRRSPRAPSRWPGRRRPTSPTSPPTTRCGAGVCRWTTRSSIAADLTQWSWNLYAQKQRHRPDRRRGTRHVGRRPGADGQPERHARLRPGQLRRCASGTEGVRAGGQAVLLTFGGSYKHNAFDMIRDRIDVNAATGAIIPTTNLILPSKYFPKSDVGESGAYVQAEMKLGRLTLVPGVRYDRFSLDADANDAVYIASLSPAAADFDADATSAKIGAAVRVTDARHAARAVRRRIPRAAVQRRQQRLHQSARRLHVDPQHRSRRRDERQHGVRRPLRRRAASVSA